MRFMEVDWIFLREQETYVTILSVPLHKHTIKWLQQDEAAYSNTSENLFFEEDL